MDKSAFIVLIQENPEDDHVRQMLTNGHARFRVQTVDRVATGLARIAGGGVDLVILDLSLSSKTEVQKLESFLDLRSSAPDAPIVVLGEPEDDGLVMRAATVAAAGYLPRPRCQTDLVPLVQSVMNRHLVQSAPRPYLVPEWHRSGAILAFLGAKGGVGTTTVSLNVASALAQRGKVILTELPPMYGTLSSYFRPPHWSGNIADLLQAGNLGAADVRASLWPCEHTPGLSVLFGPQTPEQCVEVSSHNVKGILRNLSAISSYVVADLAPNLSEANRAVLDVCDSLVLVVEREPLCVEAARRILRTIYKWNMKPPCFGSVIVNRSAYAAPMDLSEIEMQLAVPTLGVIPPAADLCVAAEKAAVPLTLFEPDNIVTRSLINLSATLATQCRKPARAASD